MKQTKAYLKTRFESLDTPDEQDFLDLFDSYLHLDEIPDPVKSDWNETDSNSDAFILNKPSLSINDLLPNQTGFAGRVLKTDGVNAIWQIETNTPNVQADWNETDSNSDAFIQNKPVGIATLSNATAGKVLTNNGTSTSWVEPENAGSGGTGGDDNVQADWNETDSNSDAFILNKPNIEPLPNQSGNAGKVLSTNGSVLSWVDQTTGQVNVQSNWDENNVNSDAFILNKPTITDLLPDQTGQNNKVLKTDGTTATWQDESGAGGGEANVQADWDVTDNSNDAYIRNKPTVGDANVQADWQETDTNSDAYIKNKPDTSAGGEDNVQADWNETDSNSDAFILNKPSVLIDDLLPDQTGHNFKVLKSISGTAAWVAENGEQNLQVDWNETNTSSDRYILNKPTLTGEQNVQADWNETDSNSDAFILNKPSIDIDDLLPDQTGHVGQILRVGNTGLFWGADIVDQNVQADWNETDSNSDAFIQNKPTITGELNVQADWDETNSSSDAFIKNKPVVGDVNVQADWNETDSNSDAFIQNKPTLTGEANVQADWNETDSNSDAFILNKPSSFGQWTDVTGGINYAGGNVGIGVAAPSETLDVNGNIRMTVNASSYFSIESPNAIITELKNVNPASSSFIVIDPISGAANNAYVRMFKDTNSTSNVRLELYRGDGSNDVQTRLSSNSNTFINSLIGNVGIGSTLAPAEKLEVAGAVTIGDSVANRNGSIRYRADVFEVREGGTWKTITGAAPSASLPPLQVTYVDPTAAVNIYSPSSSISSTYDVIKTPNIITNKTNGHLFQIMTVGTDVFFGSINSLVIRKSTDGGKNWTGVNGTGTETHITDTFTGGFLCTGGGFTSTGRMIIFLQKLTSAQVDGNYHMYSDDNGVTFSSPALTGDGAQIEGAFDSQFTKGENGELIFGQAVISGGTTYMKFYESFDNGVTFTERSTALDNSDKGWNFKEVRLRDAGNGLFFAMVNFTSVDDAGLNMPFMVVSKDYGRTWGGSLTNDVLSFTDVINEVGHSGFLPFEGSGVTLGSAGTGSCVCDFDIIDRDGDKFVYVNYAIRSGSDVGKIYHTAFRAHGWMAENRHALRSDIRFLLSVNNPSSTSGEGNFILMGRKGLYLRTSGTSNNGPVDARTAVLSQNAIDARLDAVDTGTPVI